MKNFQHSNARIPPSTPDFFVFNTHKMSETTHLNWQGSCTELQQQQLNAWAYEPAVQEVMH